MELGEREREREREGEREQGMGEGGRKGGGEGGGEGEKGTQRDGRSFPQQTRTRMLWDMKRTAST